MGKLIDRSCNDFFRYAGATSTFLHARSGASWFSTCRPRTGFRLFSAVGRPRQAASPPGCHRHLFVRPGQILFFSFKVRPRNKTLNKSETLRLVGSLICFRKTADMRRRFARSWLCGEQSHGRKRVNQKARPFERGKRCRALPKENLLHEKQSGFPFRQRGHSRPAALPPCPLKSGSFSAIGGK